MNKLYIIRYDARGMWAVADDNLELVARHQGLGRIGRLADVILHPRRQECQERFGSLVDAVRRAEQLASEYSTVAG